jgi:hypothetical protein
VAVFAPNSGDNELSGFELYDSKDLSHKVPEYITGGIPGAPPVAFVDCNFDGYVDAMMRTDLSPRAESFEIWTWDPNQKKFSSNEALTNAGINRIDSKKKLLFAGGSAGHGNSGVSTYAFSSSGKLVHLSDDFINSWKNTETRTYYRDDKEIKRTVTAAPEESQ